VGVAAFMGRLSMFRFSWSGISLTTMMAAIEDESNFIMMNINQ